MSWDDPTKMTLYHVQLETRSRIVSYEIATTEFDAIQLAKAHLRQRIDPQGSIRVGGYSSIGYVDKKPFPVFYEAKVTTGKSFEESDKHSPECPWHQDWHACNCGVLDGGFEE